MDTQKIVTRLRLSSWGEEVKERIAGGQTVSAFCEGKGISKAPITTGRRKYEKPPVRSYWRKRTARPGLFQTDGRSLRSPNLPPLQKAP